VGRLAAAGLLPVLRSEPPSIRPALRDLTSTRQTGPRNRPRAGPTAMVGGCRDFAVANALLAFSHEATASSASASWSVSRSKKPTWVIPSLFKCRLSISSSDRLMISAWMRRMQPALPCAPKS
jgi:hypothetical protein